jgi:D-alanyl-lipoteichoic acid acyltransferase DltB (MBOAT superfamily)
LTIFALGLFQKCMVADTLAPIADSTFGLSAQGVDLRFQEAWIGLVSYSLQLLFDFSGYSHMAIGLALLFGLRLPVNFLAPYRSRNLIEFWRRWHMTLAAFLRDYVYIPLGGNRVRQPLRLFNLIVTMLIGGFWHGAGWTFVLWGLLHGIALCVNHLWSSRRNGGGVPTSPAPSWWAQPLTILTVMLGWVLFRAQDLVTARQLSESLIGLHGVSVPVSWHEWIHSLEPFVRPRGLFPNINVTGDAILILVLATASVTCGPRVLAWFGLTEEDVTALPPRFRAELAPTSAPLHWTRAVAAGAMLALAIAALGRTTPFLYFQF